MAHVHTASEFQEKLRPWMIVLAPVGVSVLVMTVATAAVLSGSPDPVERSSLHRLHMRGGLSSGSEGTEQFDTQVHQPSAATVTVAPGADQEQRANRSRGFSPVGGDESAVPPPPLPTEPTPAAVEEVGGEEDEEFDDDEGGSGPAATPALRAAAKGRLRDRLKNGRGFIGKIAAARNRAKPGESVSPSMNAGGAPAQ